MEYNQLKLRILSLFEESFELNSQEVLAKLSANQEGMLTDKAVEMALLRYWRQGLLSRTRNRRRFSYKLTEKGITRRRWLLKTM